MKNKFAILDVDDTLIDFYSLFVECHDKVNPDKKSLPFKEKIKSANSSRMDIFSLIKSGGLLKDCKPIEGSREFLKDLKNRDYKIILLTARSWYKDAEEHTALCFDQQSLPYDEIIVSRLYDDKSKYIKNIKTPNCFYFSLDDNIKNCIDFKNSKIIDKSIGYSRFSEDVYYHARHNYDHVLEYEHVFEIIGENSNG